MLCKALQRKKVFRKVNAEFEGKEKQKTNKMSSLKTQLPADSEVLKLIDQTDRYSRKSEVYAE